MTANVIRSPETDALQNQKSIVTTKPAKKLSTKIQNKPVEASQDSKIKITKTEDKTTKETPQKVAKISEKNINTSSTDKIQISDTKDVKTITQTNIQKKSNTKKTDLSKQKNKTSKNIKEENIIVIKEEKQPSSNLIGSTAETTTGSTTVQIQKKNTVQPPKKQPATVKKVEIPQFYVQLNSSLDKKEGEALLKKYQLTEKGKIEPTKVNGQTYYRTTVGPFSNKLQAEQEKERIIELGHYDIFIFSKK